MVGIVGFFAISASFMDKTRDGALALRFRDDFETSGGGDDEKDRDAGSNRGSLSGERGRLWLKLLELGPEVGATSSSEEST